MLSFHAFTCLRVTNKNLIFELYFFKLYIFYALNLRLYQVAFTALHMFVRDETKRLENGPPT